MHANGTVGVGKSLAQLEGVFCVLEASGCDEKMRASYCVGPCDHSFPVAGMMILFSELLISEVGSDIEEVVAFFHELPYLLQHI